MKENEIPRLAIDNTLLYRVTDFSLLQLTVHENMNRNSHTQKNRTKYHAR